MKSHWYRALLHLLPASFRNEYADAILAAEAASRPSPLGAIGDVARAAASAHGDILRQDLRHAARTIRRSPGFALTVIVILALGIGATTAAYSLVYHVLLGPLPYPHSQQLVQIQESQLGPNFGRFTNQLSPANYADWAKASRSSLAAIGAWSGGPMDLTGSGEPQRLAGVVVTASLLPLIGIAPERGRFFTVAEDRLGGPDVVILSDALWHQLGAKPDIIGSHLTLSGAAYTVIGVMPPWFAFPNALTQIWTPFQLSAADTDRSNTYLTVVGRLRPGATIAAAQSELAAEAAHLAAAYPTDLKGIGAYVSPLQWQTRPQRRIMLWALLGGALCVLLIACLNLANLVLARLLARREEWITRTALGAGRDRLLRQLLTEMLLLATIGGLAGIALAQLLLPLLGRFTPSSLPVAATPSLNLPVLALAAGLTVAAGVCFGVLPAMRWSRGQAMQNTRSAASRGHSRLRPALVIAEIAGCLLLVALCALLGRALEQIATTPSGYRSDHVLTLRTDLPQPKYARLADQSHYFQTVLDRIRALPGTQAAGFTSFLPTRWMFGIPPVSLPGQTVPLSQRPIAFLRLNTPGYLNAMGIPLLRGRYFTRGDGPQAPKVAIVSADFAARFWPDLDPLGRQFNFAGATRTVVGVAGAVRMWGPERTSPPQVYLPYTQSDMAPIYLPKDLAIRSQLATDALTAAVRRIVHHVEPNVPISNLEPLADVTAPLLGPRRRQLDLYASFGALALLLSALGIYGLLAFEVASRAPEMAVRMALGARPGRLVAQVLASALRLAVYGISIGLALALAAARVLPALLGRIPSGELVPLALAAAVCLATTLIAGLRPALRAARLDPASTLRAG